MANHKYLACPKRLHGQQEYISDFFWDGWCSNCLYWDPRGQKREGGDDAIGLCRKHAPSPGFVDNQISHSVTWPLTGERAVCADWEFGEDVSGEQSERQASPQKAVGLIDMSYDEYLQTPHWLSVRKVAYEYASHRCQLCNAGGEIHAHHRTYERRGCEEPADITVLCAVCHGKFHDISEATDGEKTPQLTDWEKKAEMQRAAFIPPTVDEIVSRYAGPLITIGETTAREFIEVYTARKWRTRGGVGMRNWQSALIAWNAARKERLSRE